MKNDRSQPGSSASRSPAFALMVLPVICSAIALTVIVGWLFDITLLTHVLADLPAMQFNTALCFLFMSAAVVALLRERPRFAILFASIPTVLSLLSLIRSLTGVDLGLDQSLLINSLLPTNGSASILMSWNTALCFIGLATALVALSTRRAPAITIPLAGLCASLVIGAALVMLSASVATLDAVGQHDAYTTTALHTGHCFCLLGAFLFVRATQLHSSLLHRQPRWVIGAAAIGALTLAVMTWQIALIHSNAQLQQHLVDKTNAVQETVASGIEDRVRALQRMTERWQVAPTPQTYDRYADAAAYLGDMPDLQLIAWVDPTDGDPDVACQSGLSNEVCRRLLSQVDRTEPPSDEHTTLSLLSRDSSGDIQLAICIAAVRNATRHELIAVVNLNRFFGIVRPANTDQTVDVRFHVSSQEQAIVASDHPSSHLGMVQVRDLSIPCSVQPRSATTALARSPIPYASLLVGVIGLLLLPLCVGLAQHAAARSAQLQIEVAERLEAEQQLRALNATLEERVADRTETIREHMVQLSITNDHIRTSNEALKKRIEVLDRFAYIASHDLQEPLRKIQAFGQILTSEYRPKLGEEGADLLGRMNSAASRMRMLIDDLLTYSRISSRAQVPAKTNLNDTLTGVLQDFEVSIQQAGATIETETLPTITADPLQMQLLLQNLLSNALKFRKDDTPPRIRIKSEFVDNQQACRISVMDNGIGFEQRFTDRIFSPFQRLHNRSHSQGSGMGLAICARIVERHGGSIEAVGTPGQGASFTITLPLMQPQIGVTADAA